MSVIEVSSSLSLHAEAVDKKQSHYYLPSSRPIEQLLIELTQHFPTRRALQPAECSGPSIFGHLWLS